jgi:hypothetical protein
LRVPQNGKRQRRKPLAFCTGVDKGDPGPCERQQQSGGLSGGERNVRVDATLTRVAVQFAGDRSVCSLVPLPSALFS